MARLALLALLVPMLAAAQPDQSAEAQLQYEFGADLYAQRRYAEALERFLASNRLVPNANVVSNIAQTYALLERWVDAYNWYETYLTQFPLDAEARARGQQAQGALVARVAVIEVRTDPPGAALYIDRADLGSVGVSPRRIATTAGAHTIVARLVGRREARGQATAAVGRVASASLSLEAIVGTLRVRSEPPGAQVVLEGRAEPLGVTPLEIELPAGQARLTLSARDHAEVTRLVEIEDSHVSELEVELEPLAASVSILSVMAQPGARVSVDGRDVGAVPLTLGRLAPGAHAIEVSADGRESWRDEIVLEAGGATRVTATLEGSSSLAFEDLRWVGYIGGGSLLLGGGAFGVAAVPARGAFYADPSRSQLDLVGTLNGLADVLMVSGLAILAVTVVLDLAIGPRPRSRARVEIDR